MLFLVDMTNLQLLRYAKKYKKLESEELLSLQRILYHRFMQASRIDGLSKPLVKAMAKIEVELLERIEK